MAFLFSLPTHTPQYLGFLFLFGREGEATTGLSTDEELEIPIPTPSHKDGYLEVLA